MRTWATAFGRWWRRLPPAVVDVAVAGIVAAVVDIAIHVANEPDSRPPDIWAYLIGSAIGAVLLARRQRPLLVLFATAALLFVYYTANYPGIQPALPLAVALYGGAAVGKMRWSVIVAAFYIAAGFAVGMRLKVPFFDLLNGSIQPAALLGAVILFGETVHSRQVRLAEAERRREADAAARVTEERLRIARDVHDIVGHSIAAITIQAGVARDLFDNKPDEARAALDVALRTARNAMADLKLTVRGLRSDQPQGDGWLPAPSLSDVDKLVATAADVGLRVTVSVTGERRTLPSVMELSAYRIVQESLTNVVRHAKARTAAVVIDYGVDELAIEITDDGVGPVANGARPAGYGTVGMSERLAALGGRLTTGPGASGGYVVRAWIPITEVA